MKDAHSISHIYNGAIVFYYSFKIDTHYNYKNLCCKLNRKLSNIYFDGLDYAKPKTKRTSKHIKPISIPDDTEVAGDSKLSSYSARMFYKSIQDYVNNFSSLGFTYTVSQARFNLPPIKIIMKNKEAFLTEATLSIFQNKSAILQITFKLNNIASEALLKNNLDDYILKATSVCDNQEFVEPIIATIRGYYCQLIMNMCKLKELICFDEIKNVILANHSMPFDDVGHLPDSIVEYLYKICMAPLPERNSVSYLEEAKKHLEKNAFLSQGYGYITSDTGICVSIIEKGLSPSVNGSPNQGETFESIIDTIQRKTEGALTLLLLKKVNDTFCFEKKLSLKNDFYKIKNYHNENKIFLSSLQSEAGSETRRLLAFFEKTMIFFLDAKNAEERFIAINNILEQEQAERMSSLQNIVSFLGLVFPIVFGLPAINETLLFLRRLCSFIKNDIEILSIANCSFALWFVIIGLSIFFFTKLKIKRIKRL